MAATKKAKKNSGASREVRDYVFHLGKFIHLYAAAESMWHLAFRGIAKIPDAVARAISGNVRGGDLIAMTRRVAKAKRIKIEKINELELLAAQFNAISEFRDRLIHRGASPHKEKIVSTNAISVKSIDDLEILEFTEKDITAACVDLASIEVRLSFFARRIPFRIVPNRLDVFFEPWRYKRLEPRTPNRRPKIKNSQARSRQRHASQR